MNNLFIAQNQLLEYMRPVIFKFVYPTNEQGGGHYASLTVEGMTNSEAYSNLVRSILDTKDLYVPFIRVVGETVGSGYDFCIDTAAVLERYDNTTLRIYPPLICDSYNGTSPVSLGKIKTAITLPGDSSDMNILYLQLKSTGSLAYFTSE